MVSLQTNKAYSPDTLNTLRKGREAYTKLGLLDNRQPVLLSVSLFPKKEKNPLGLEFSLESVEPHAFELDDYHITRWTNAVSAYIAGLGRQVGILIGNSPEILFYLDAEDPNYEIFRDIIDALGFEAAPEDKETFRLSGRKYEEILNGMLAKQNR